jgi:phosphohistidine phosphatase
MRVILFRHGPAEARDPRRWPDDRLRPLTAKGEARTRRAARGLRRLEGGIRVVLTSPLVRCASSAELVAHETEAVNGVQAVAALAPGGSWRAVLARFAEESPEATLVAVGHEPDLGKLAGVLLFGAPAALAIKKAGACSIDLADEVAAGGGQLRWFLPPRTLSRLAPSRSKV